MSGKSHQKRQELPGGKVMGSSWGPWAHKQVPSSVAWASSPWGTAPAQGLAEWWGAWTEITGSNFTAASAQPLSSARSRTLRPMRSSKPTKTLFRQRTQLEGQYRRQISPCNSRPTLSSWCYIFKSWNSIQFTYIHHSPYGGLGQQSKIDMRTHFLISQNLGWYEIKVFPFP